MVYTASVIPAGIVGRSSLSLRGGSGKHITLGEGAHLVSLFRRFDTRMAAAIP